MRSKSKYLVLLAVTGLALLPKIVTSCAPDFPEAIFTRKSGPDKPMSSFANGRIGIILPSWQRAYLTVAYRYLENKPLHAEEQKSLMEFWDYNGTVDVQPSNAALEDWLNERSKYRKTPPPGEISQYRSNGIFANELNCAPPAFRMAVATLRDREKRYGETSSDLQEWLNGQDLVFQNCAHGTIIPAILPLNANSLLRADRNYQIAAAHFYSSDLEAARKEFGEIARSFVSPWHEVAAYMVARTWIRQAEKTAAKDENYNPEPLKNAEPVLKAIMGNPHNSMRHDAQRLLGFVRYQLYSEQRKHELARLLIDDQSGQDFGQHLRDYTMLLDRTLDEEPDFPGVEHWGAKYEKLKKEWKLQQYDRVKKERTDELGDWLITFQSESVSAKMHADAQWRATGSMPWLVAAVAKSAGSDANAAELIAAAARVPESSSAYATLAYHVARLHREQGHYELARQTLSKLLAHRATLPLSAVNLLEDEEAQVTSDIQAFAAKVGRTPVEITAECIDWEDKVDVECARSFYGTDKPTELTKPLPQIDIATAVMLNTKIPVELYARIASSRVLAANVRKEMLLSAWTRAMLLGRAEIAGRVADSASQAEPLLKPYIQQYERAQTDEERTFVAAYTILHFPGLRPFIDRSLNRLATMNEIDAVRDNWWCTDVGGNPAEVNYYKQRNNERYPEQRTAPSADFPFFLSVEQKHEAAAEWSQLHSLGTAGRYLPRIVLAWAHKHPEDRRIPEALHYAERAVHLGCDDGNDNRYGRDVFQLLHRNYPKSKWTRKTPFWYGMTLKPSGNCSSCGTTPCSVKN